MAPARARPAECGVDLDGVVLVVRRLDIVELLLVIRKLANHLLQAATANYINSRRYREALNTLDQVNERSGMWYYLSSCANAGCGNNILARDHAAQAVNMEPGNPQYRQLLNQLEFGSNRYSNSPYGGGYAPGSSNSCGTGNLCCDLWIADSLCECMGGDLCTCI